MKVVLLTPARRFIANRRGLGYQVPLGLVLLGGPLADAGHDVRLVDNDVYGWDDDRLALELRDADAVLIGHTGSTAAHGTCLATAAALRERLPRLRIAYGGVFPTYHARESLERCAAIDAVVRGEGEQTALELVDAWAHGIEPRDVSGVVWRDGGELRINRPRPPIRCLDDYRPGWELVDWPRYELFGCGRSAGIQFSRGCPLSCSYCGQWQFWRRWRHRSPENFVEQLTVLATRYGVRIAWLADENFAADRDVAREVLERLETAQLDVSLNLNMTAADVVRDRDLLPLYKRAGVDYVVMGIEALDDDVVASIGKDNPFAVSLEAVRALRENGIVSLVNVIYGLEEESLRTCLAKLRGLYRLDPDIANCVYLTPHAWTPEGRATDVADVIQHDRSLWTYRNQVLRTPHLSPAQLFALVKLTETAFHLRPRALARLVRGDDVRVRRIRRASLAVGGRVVAAELREFAGTRFASPQEAGGVAKPGASAAKTRTAMPSRSATAAKAAASSGRPTAASAAAAPPKTSSSTAIRPPGDGHLAVGAANAPQSVAAASGNATASPGCTVQPHQPSAASADSSSRKRTVNAIAAIAPARVGAGSTAGSA